MTHAVILALLAGVFPALPSAQAPSGLQGAWQVVEVTTTGPAGSTNSNPQPGLYLFTARHYSIISVLSQEPRPAFKDRTTSPVRRHSRSGHHCRPSRGRTRWLADA